MGTGKIISVVVISIENMKMVCHPATYSEICGWEANQTHISSQLLFRNLANSYIIFIGYGLPVRYVGGGNICRKHEIGLPTSYILKDT